MSERLLATLLYYRLYVTGTLLSYLFDLDESNLCRERNHRMLPALQEVLPTPMQDHLLSALKTKTKTKTKTKSPSAASASAPSKNCSKRIPNSKTFGPMPPNKKC